MIIGIPRETFPGERRVALVPGDLASLTKLGHTIFVESGAGLEAGHLDSAYESKGAKVAASRASLFAEAQVVVQVRGYGVNPEAGKADVSMFRAGQIVIGFLDPLGKPKLARELAERSVAAFAMELVPRITRAQTMDALSSMANLAGYKSVILAAERLPKILPMMMTAAGTITAAKTFVLGAGVAGLQAIATAKRLGSVVEAYDVRAEVKEQVQSVGGKFVQLDMSSVQAGEQAGDAGGYAKAQSEAFYAKQRELLANYIRVADMIITTAAVPGKRAPILITAEMLKGSRRGAVVVDLAAESGGNCELTRAGEVVVVDGVTILGPVNLPSTMAIHASQLYSRNVASLLVHLTAKDSSKDSSKDAGKEGSKAGGQIKLDTSDDITRETMFCQDGKITHPRVMTALG